MNYKQEQAIEKSREKINEIRHMLDDIMYHSEPIDNKTHNRIREVYDMLCDAHDKLP